MIGRILRALLVRNILAEQRRRQQLPPVGIWLYVKLDKPGAALVYRVERVRR